MGLNLKRLGSKIWDQANPFDAGLSYSTRQVNPATPPPSVLSQGAHEAVQVGKSVVQPFVGLGKAAYYVPQAVSREIQNKPIYDIQQKAFGTTDQGNIARQIIGNTAGAALTVAAPGATRGIEAGVSKLLPTVVPKLVPRIVSNASIGAGFNAASAAGQGQNITPQTLATGALLGGAFPIAGAAARSVVKLRPLNQVGSVPGKTRGVTYDDKTLAKMAQQNAIPDPALQRVDALNNAMLLAAEAPKLKPIPSIKPGAEGMDYHTLRNKLIATKAGIKPLNEKGSAQVGGPLIPIPGQKPKVVLRNPAGSPKASISNEPAFLRKRPSSLAEAETLQGLGNTQRLGKKQMSPAEARYREAQSIQREYGTPSFMRQGQQALNEARQRQIAVTTPEEFKPFGLLAAPSGRATGEGFTMSPRANEHIIQSGKSIAAIDKVLDRVRAGKVSKSPDEVRTLISQRQELVANLGKPPVVEPPKPKVSLKNELSGVTHSPLDAKPSDIKALNYKIANVKDPIRKAELIAERDALAPAADKNLAGLEPLSPYTTAPKEPNAFARAWQTVSGVISQYGTAGKEVAKRLGLQRDQSEVGQQAFLSKIPTVNGLGKSDFTTFVQTLDKLDKGEPVTMPPHIQQAIAEWNAAIPEIRARAVAAGLDVGDLGPNYFPRQYKDLYNNRGLGKLAEQMVREGRATDLGDAMGKLQFMKTEYQRPFGNLENTRKFDLAGYETTHEALGNYINRSFDRITKAEQFGHKNEVLHELQGRAQQEGYNAAPGSTFDKYIKIALGDVDKSTTGHKISSGIRKVNALRSLSAAGLSNATQLTNTATVAGIGRTIKGIVRLAVSPAARAEAQQTGILLDHAIEQLSAQGLGTGGKISRNLASPFFRQVEKFNRQATAIVGKDFGNSLARKGDVAQLREKFGVTGPIGKNLTREQEIQVSRKLVELSQFKVDPMDLPGWVDSPMGKLVAQFRTFGYKQSGFMYNQVLREAMKGNLLPLTRFVALAVPLGSATLAAKGAIKGTQYTQPNESNASKSAKALAAVGAFGLPGSEGQNIYKSNQYGNTPAALAGVVGGPTASILTETATNIGDKGLAQHNWKPLAKEGIRSVPAVGPSIANRVFPKAPTPTKPNAIGTPVERNASAKQERTALGVNAGNGYTLQQTSDGKYAYTLDGDTTVHTAKTLQEARLKVAEAGFSNETGSYKQVGDNILRRSPDGKVSVISKTKFDYQLGTATLIAQKNANDLQGWNKTAESQLKSIQKQLQDPSIDPLEALQLENQAEALLNQAVRYQEYGGFTKPKSNSRTSSRSTGSAYKYAVSLRAGGSAPRVQGSKPRLTSSKVAAASAPKAKVTLKKSRV